MSSGTSTSRNPNVSYHPLTDNSSHLAPRTPHSRAGRPVTSFNDNETRYYDDEDAHINNPPRRGGGGMQGGDDRDEIDMLNAQQNTPLLRSSASDHYPIPQPPPRVSPYPATSTTTHVNRDRRSQHDGSSSPFTGGTKTFFETVPLVLGAIGACVLFALILLSFNKPDLLQRYILKNSTTTDPNVLKEIQHAIHGWIDYMNYTKFPLDPYEYEEECWKVSQRHGSAMHHGHYWDTITTYGLLPEWRADGRLERHPLDVWHPKKPGEDGVCSSTITYMLDGEVGLFYDLALLAQTAAFARERNRTLLIDDSRWNRGRWTDHFEDIRTTQPGPEPNCIPPPANELVACPRSARHWIVTQRTAKFHFGHDFAEAYEDPYKSDETRQKPIYEHAYASFQETILPNEWIREEISELRRRLAKKPYVGIHIRHGDRYPANQKWEGDFVPTSEYVATTTRMWNTLRTQRPTDVRERQPSVYIATDSFAAFQDFRSLSGLPAGNVWGLHEADKLLNGRRRWKLLASPHGYVQRVFNGRKTRPEERARWTKGMIIDYALLSGAWLGEGERGPSAVICTAT
ncbi:hypothetical protein CPB86DRAFT_527541 [Serendipita vermifera]|nr:hypothetical protein CPB86DRAFT_527541 [Serendipita vermifera]